MTMSGLSYLASLYLWWWLASLATGLLVGWRSVMPDCSIPGHRPSEPLARD